MNCTCFMILCSYHSIPVHIHRVIGPMVNNADFASAFNCPEGSPMNPKDKCLLW